MTTLPAASTPGLPAPAAPPTCAVLHLGDCREIMRGMADGSIDAVVTDPPYGQTNESYDSPVAFDPAVWRECHRVAGPNAALVSFAGSPTYHRIASAIEAGGWRVRQMWGWVYRDGLLTSAWPKEGFDRLAPAFDPIVYATKGKVLLNFQREGRPWKAWFESKPEHKRMSARSGHCGTMEQSGHWPRSIASDGTTPFEYFALSRTNFRQRVEATDHPNQKPLALMRWLLSKLPPGGTIFDPFMGSGTTGVAALAEGFHFVGCDQSPEYHALADRRLAAVSASPHSLSPPRRPTRRPDADRPLFRLLSPDLSDVEPNPPAEER